MQSVFNEAKRSLGKVISIVLQDQTSIAHSDWATLAQDRAGWLKLVTKVPFDFGKPQLRPPRCDTMATKEIFLSPPEGDWI